MNGWPTFTIVCTGRQTHQARILDTFEPVPPPSWAGDPATLGETWSEWSRIAERNRNHSVKARDDANDRGSSAWAFPCPTCQINERISDDNLGKLVMGYRAAGRMEWDISTRR